MTIEYVIRKESALRRKQHPTIQINDVLCGRGPFERLFEGHVVPTGVLRARGRDHGGQLALRPGARRLPEGEQLPARGRRPRPLGVLGPFSDEMVYV